MSYYPLILALKGGSGSGNFGHYGRPGKLGGSASGSGGRVWQGAQHEAGDVKLSKLEAGAIGEKLAMRVLSEKFGVPFETLNVGINNAPIDVGGDSLAIEVKTGIATNGPTAQHFRATIGQPGKAESELLKQMTSDEKKAHNAYKYKQIMKRKNDLIDVLSAKAGAPIKPITVGIILSADGKRGDIFLYKGFHLRLPWNKYATNEYFIGSYDVE